MSTEEKTIRLRLSQKLAKQLKRAAKVYEMPEAEVFRRAMRYYSRRAGTVNLDGFEDTTTYGGDILKVKVPECFITTGDMARTILNWYLGLWDYKPAPKVVIRSKIPYEIVKEEE